MTDTRRAEFVEASAWWALVMGAAAALEDAAINHQDPDAKRAAEGAAKHYRDAAKVLYDAAAAVQGGERVSLDSAQDP